MTLLPCPFCGATPQPSACLVLTDPSGKWGAVECRCGARGPDVRTGYARDVTAWAEVAASEWNRRGQKP